MKYGAETERLMRQYGEITWRPAEGSKIEEFYKGKSVFVTGASGFLGQLLVEKLLRACPDIETVYILMRPKRGEDELARVDKIFSDPIFSVLAKISPKFQHKIVVIKGDCSLPGLGINESDKEIIMEHVNAIFHVAATVRFDEKMPLAVAINVRGARDLLEIAKECKNLATYVHVSSAYTNCNQAEIQEKFYAPPVTGDELIEMMEKLPEQTVIENAKELIGDWPNTYTYTKAIAEDAVRQHAQGLPVCIVRPAVVIATYKEPLRSWINNLYGATGVVAGAGTGLLKTLHCDENKAAEIVPADYVINAMIAASYKTAVEKRVDEVPIYNYVSSVENRHTWKEFMYHVALWGEEIPTMGCVWYYSLTLNKYVILHYIYTLFLHMLPGLIVDTVAVLTGRAPMMLKIYNKINKFEEVIAHFATNEWLFRNDNTQALWKYLSESDKQNFPFDMKSLDWTEYHKTHVMGIRQYLLKDDISTLPEARKKWRRFYILHHVVRYVFWVVLARILYALLRKIFAF